MSATTNKDRVYDPALKSETRVTLYSDVLGSNMFGLEGSIENLSSGGMCATFPIHRISPDDRYLIRMAHPSIPFKVIHCKVAWSRFYSGFQRVGLQFLNIPGDTKQHLQEYLGEFLNSSATP